MENENKHEILNSLIESARNEAEFTATTLADYLLANGIDPVDMDFYKSELTKRGLFVDENEGSDEFPEEPSGDDISEMEDPDDDMMDDDLSDEEEVVDV
ncbi:MAG: hypothetical protein HUK24_08920, partial [Sphaerochaetaceae bacterium]|nr:hypothetical protein [Sphaerochaetaceae bacterium]